LYPGLLSSLPGSFSRSAAVLSLRCRPDPADAAGNSRLRLAPGCPKVSEAGRFPSCARLGSGSTAIAFHRRRQSSQRYLQHGGQPTLWSASEASLSRCRSALSLSVLPKNCSMGLVESNNAHSEVQRSGERAPGRSPTALKSGPMHIIWFFLRGITHSPESCGILERDYCSSPARPGLQLDAYA